MKTPQKLKLFDLENDLGEQNNIAAQHPEIVKRMEEIMIEAHQPLTTTKGKAGKEGKKAAGKGKKAAGKGKKKLNSTPPHPTGKG